MSAKTFIQKLWIMVNDPNNSQQIWWSSDGESFVYTSSFQHNVLKTNFQLKSLASFVRQLNMYGFKKRKHPEKLSEFHHPFFKRDKQNMLVKIRRKHLEDNTFQLLENQQKVQNQNQILEKGDKKGEGVKFQQEAQDGLEIDRLGGLRQQLEINLARQRSSIQVIRQKFLFFMEQLENLLNKQSEERYSPLSLFIIEHLKPSIPVLSYIQYEQIASHIVENESMLNFLESPLQTFITRTIRSQKQSILL